MIRVTSPRERAEKDKDDIRAILTFTDVDLEAVRRKAEREGTRDILESLIR
jgi:hypothetical protein